MNYNFITIEGNIGAGKTSLVKKIAEDRNAKAIFEEFTDNPFLPDFYKEPQRFAFTLEMSFLADRYHQINKEIPNPDLFDRFTISDYFFMKSIIFAKTNLDNQEYKLYRDIFNIIYKSIPKPDLLVYLHKDTNILLKNITKRGREYEKEITADYLTKIHKGYFDFFRQHDNLKILIINANEIDFIDNPNDYQKLLSYIFDMKHKTGLNSV